MPSDTPPAPPKAADADLLGEAVPLQPPAMPTPDAQPLSSESKAARAQAPAAKDENQAGFIGERNRPLP